MNGTKDCGGHVCSFAYSEGSLGCQNGTGDCSLAQMLSAEISEFHDQTLADATQEIIEILSAIPEDKQGRKLSFLHTKMGTFLAWVKHGDTEMPKDALTVDSPDSELAKALRLKNYAARGAKGA